MGLHQGARIAGRGGWGIIAILVMLIIVSAAGADDRVRPGMPVTDIDIPNHSAINTTSLEKFHKSVEPVSIIHAEISDTSLPGPRYMAIGPAAIDISVSPVIISALIVLVFIGIGIWAARPGRTVEREEDREP